MTNPEQYKNREALPARQPSPAEGVIDSARAQAQKVGRAAATLREKLAGEVSNNSAETHLTNGLERADAPTQSPDKPKTQKASSFRLDEMIDSTVKGLEKGGEALTPFLERMGEMYESTTGALRRLLAPLAATLQKMGQPVPEWLIYNIPGLKEVESALAKNSRTLTPDAKDTITMRGLMKLHKETESTIKQKGGMYSFEQFMEDAVVRLPIEKDAVTLKDIATSAALVAKDKEKERVTPAPAATTPAPASTTQSTPPTS